MSDPQPSTPEKPSALSLELKEILEFNERENQKHRDFFEDLYTKTVRALATILTAVVALVSFIGWRTVLDIRKQANGAISEEIKATEERSQKATQDEIERLRREIAARIDQEFRTPTIRETVRLAARQQRQSAMMPLIQHEVSTQVAKGVTAQIKSDVQPKLTALQRNQTFVSVLTQA